MPENSFIKWKDNPEKLEELYRTDKKEFKRDFYNSATELADDKVFNVWKARLNYRKPQAISIDSSRHQVLSTIIICAIMFLFTKIPYMLGIADKDEFFAKNFSLIILAGLLMTVFYRNKVNLKPILGTVLTVLGLTIYINIVPGLAINDVNFLLKLHLPFLLWFIWCLSYIDFDLKVISKRNDFVKNNGNIAIMSIVIALGLFAIALLALGLFKLIDIDIEHFLEKNIFLWFTLISPIIAFVITENYPDIAGRISPIMVRIFSPITLVTLLIYLALLPFSTKSLYENRDSLLVFNLSLFLVLAIISFGLLDKHGLKSKIYRYIYLCLGLVAFVINIIALSAIFYRITQYGLSPNKLAVLGSNLVISAHLAMLILALIKFIRKGCEEQLVTRTVGLYLPVYAVWIVIVLISFPILF